MSNIISFGKQVGKWANLCTTAVCEVFFFFLILQNDHITPTVHDVHGVMNT